jgi:tellurite resistance protein TerC
VTTWWWVLFGALALALPMVDLLVVERRAPRESLRRAAGWSVAWVTLGLLFALVVGVARGHAGALAYVTAYLVEVSLSVDNLFVFAALFAYFGVAQRHQHRVLFWGIFGAIVMRGLFIFAGLSLIARFHWLIYLLGALLVATGIRLGLQREGEMVHPERNVVVRWAGRVLPLTRSYNGDRFAVRLAEGWRFTPLVLVLLAIESTDVVFAVDSVPAVLGVSRDPFVVYTSNVFAVMGLRSLYFMLAGALRSFRFLRPALALILVLIGIKMVLADVVEVPTAVSLAVVMVLLAIGTVLSLLLPQRTGTSGT